MLVKTYFIINSNTENCELKISTTNQSIKFIDFGDGESLYVEEGSIYHSYQDGYYEGYFESSCTELEISGPINEMSELPNSLTSLKINNTFLNSLDSLNLNTSFKDLVELDISNNKITKLEISDSLESLETLIADNCQLTLFSNFGKSNIKKLSLNNNDFSLTGLNLKDFNLLKLNASNCKLNDYNFFISQTIEELDLSSNDFMYLDFSSIDINLPNLTKIDLSNNLLLNSITGFTSKIKEIIVNKSPNLEILNLENVINLEKINISETKIQDLDVKNLSNNIQEYSISKSKIDIEEYLDSGVEIVNLENNDLFGSLTIKNTNLKMLNLSNNKLEEITFEGDFINLEEIRLNNNNIRIIRFGNKKVSKFPKLRVLDLSNNLIENWTQSTTNCDDISNFNKLVELNLDNNNLQYFHLNRTNSESNSNLSITLNSCLKLNFINIGFLNYNPVRVCNLSVNNCPNLLVSNVNRIID